MAIGDALLGAGTAAATGNYVSAGLDMLGVGMQLFGANQQANIANQESTVSQDIQKQEQAENVQRQQAMQLSARRQQIQIVRNTQRQRSMGLTSATSQGANLGSGFAGGQADVQNQGDFMFQGVAQNLQIGNNIFGLDQTISRDKSQLSGLQAQNAQAGTWNTIGGAIEKSATPFGNLSGQMFASNTTGGQNAGNVFNQTTGAPY